MADGAISKVQRDGYLSLQTMLLGRKLHHGGVILEFCALASEFH